MNSRLYNLTMILGILTLSFLVSCQDTIPKRSLISSGSTVPAPECDENQELVTEKDNDGEEVQICKEKEFVRPSGVSWNTDYCICKDGKALSYGNCSSFCASKNTSGAEMLYATFKLSDAILLNKEIETLYNWCQKVLEGDQANPACAIQAKDESGNITLINEVTVSSTSNSLSTNVQNLLAYDKTYVLTLVEKTSGVKSDSIQMIKFSQDMSLPILGPLKNVPVSQYSCIVREYSDATNIANAYRLHFYFKPSMAPDPMPANSPVLCHDYLNPLYGTVDKDGFPRLETIPGVFNLWDETDPRFYDNNGNTLIDINEAIVQKTKNFGATIPSNSKFFYPLNWQNGLQIKSENDNSNTNTTFKSLGYFMAPWIDQSTYKSYCLTNTHYNSTNPLFKALRDYIGVETEGLYVGIKSPETVTTNEGETVTGADDAILIRESDVKAVWFYYKNGVPTAPTDDNVASNTIYFYYPLNKTSPFVRSSTQKIYRVKSAQEINAQASSNTPAPGATSGGNTTSYPPHDRKIGCIPKF